MRNIWLSLVAALLPLSPAFAQQPDYSADDIVRFFEAPKPQATRGICVGSDEECGMKTEERPLTFDLLVTFEKNSANLTEAAQNNLLQFSAALRHPKLVSSRFAVEGFTDASGSGSHNLDLSQRRADSVVSFLNDLGIDPARLEAKGFGETRMRMPDPYDPGNRRVETRRISE
jgi:outer membrane protein OmpA-like peptidoglycan-associated protein